jgi:hypothetical protein
MATSGAPAPKERRQFGRLRIGLQAELLIGGQSASIRVTTTDISLGGCYVEMMFTLPVGTPLQVVLWLDDAKVVGGAVVATCDPQFGNGIRFVDMTWQDKVRLEKYLAEVASRPAN